MSCTPGSSGGRLGVRWTAALDLAGDSHRLGRRDVDLGRQLLMAYDGPVAARQVGHLHAVVATAVLRVQSVDLLQHPGPLTLAHERDVRDRPGEVGEGGRGVRLPEPEGRLLDEPEVGGLHQRLRRVVDLSGVGSDQVSEPSHPGDVGVVGVPGQGQVSAGAQDARDLGEGQLVVEPVERLAAHHDVGRARGERDRLRTCDHVRDADPDRQLAEHVGQRLRGEDLVATAPDQDLGELAGAGAELEHQGRSRRVAAPDQPGDGIVGVGGAGPVVGVGHGPERPCGRRAVKGVRLAHPALEVT